MKDHTVEDERSASNTISGEAIEDDVTERDSEQDEIFCRVCDPVDEDIEADDEEESEVQRPLKDPGMSTRREVPEHDLTHMPLRPWCPRCVKGKSKETPSLMLSGPVAENMMPRICLEYCFLTENELGRDESTEGDEVVENPVENPDKIDGESQTVLVIQESECSSIWLCGGSERSIRGMGASSDL